MQWPVVADILMQFIYAVMLCVIDDCANIVSMVGSVISDCASIMSVASVQVCHAWNAGNERTSLDSVHHRKCMT